MSSGCYLDMLVNIGYVSDSQCFLCKQVMIIEIYIVDLQSLVL